MKKHIKNVILLVFVLLFACFLSACSADSVEKLFSLPTGADEYLSLETMINEELDMGAQYSPPSSGEYRQSVQLEDLDGDGTDEAIVFLKRTSDTKPLKLNIYKQKHDEFTKVASLEGDGTGFDSISYVDMNGDGCAEIVICRQISSGMKILTIYSTKNYEMEMLMSTNFSGYTVCDLSDSKGSDIFVVRDTTAEQKNYAELYSYKENGEMMSMKAEISSGTSKLTRLRNSVLSDGKNAVFVEGILADNTFFTDIFAVNNGVFKNITRKDDSGVSNETLRAYEVYCRVMNIGEGLLVPKPIIIQPENNMSPFRIVEWYSYSSNGEKTLSLTTYAPPNDGWLIRLGAWKDKLSYIRTVTLTGEKSTIFGFTGANGEYVEVFSIYQISGNVVDERSMLMGRFVLEADSDTVFSGKILNAAAAEKLGITEESLKESFEIVYSEWKTGVI